MDNIQIRRMVAALETTRVSEEETAWRKLKPLGPKVLPFFLEHYPRMRKWQGRVSLLYHAIPFAREHNDAVHLGITATRDKATQVRYRACMLLAYSLNRKAVPHLQELLRHWDQKTVEDAKAAIDAIEHNNSHYFIDRGHTGRSFWEAELSAT